MFFPSVVCQQMFNLIRNIFQDQCFRQVARRSSKAFGPSQYIYGVYFCNCIFLFLYITDCTMYMYVCERNKQFQQFQHCNFLTGKGRQVRSVGKPERRNGSGDSEFPAAKQQRSSAHHWQCAWLVMALRGLSITSIVSYGTERFKYNHYSQYLNLHQR